jgi:hypothetical protein
VTKTHAELLGCPHCGKQPRHKSEKFSDFTTGEIEIITTIFCENPECSPDSSIEGWNTRVNKEAEFLEGLKSFLDIEIDKLTHAYIRSPIMEGKLCGYENIKTRINQFEAEQKVNSET